MQAPGKHRDDARRAQSAGVHLARAGGLRISERCFNAVATRALEPSPHCQPAQAGFVYQNGVSTRRRNPHTRPARIEPAQAGFAFQNGVSTPWQPSALRPAFQAAEAPAASPADSTPRPARRPAH